MTSIIVLAIMWPHLAIFHRIIL